MLPKLVAEEKVAKMAVSGHQKQSFRVKNPSSLFADTSRVINTPSSSNDDVYVTPVTGGGAAPACQPITARQLQWNWTPAGQVALQPCPIGATGLASFVLRASLTCAAH